MLADAPMIKAEIVHLRTSVERLTSVVTDLAVLDVKLANIVEANTQMASELATIRKDVRALELAGAVTKQVNAWVLSSITAGVTALVTAGVMLLMNTYGGA